MLTHEAAEKRLEAFKAKDGLQRRLADVRALPDPLRGLASDLVGHALESNQTTDYHRLPRVQYAAAAAINQLPEPDRLRIFAALFGGLCRQAEATWQALSSAPYQMSYNRRPFRAPGHPDVYSPRQAAWAAGIFKITSLYEQDITWWAEWAGYLPIWQRGVSELGWLFAGTMDRGGDEGQAVYDTLTASAKGEHPIGVMGRHVTRGLLSANNPQGCEFIEKLLLAAQRQEGLRQVILETIDEAQPAAFHRMLHLILNENLLRFSATIRAATVWFGLPWDVENRRSVERAIRTVLRYLDALMAGADALDDGNDAEKTFLALWSLAFLNAASAQRPALDLLADPSVDKRFAATYFLTQLGLWQSQLGLLQALGDEDLRVAALAAEGMQDGPWETFRQTDAFERVEAALPRFPKTRRVLAAPIWPWFKVPVDQGRVAKLLLQNLFDRTTARLIPHLPLMDARDRAESVSLIEGLPAQDPARRATLLALAGDSSETVREKAVKALSKTHITSAEALEIEALLTRKPGDLRRGAIGLLLQQEDRDALQSGQRLLHSRSPMQRLAGIDLLRRMAEDERLADDCRAAGRAYLAAQSEVAGGERELLNLLCDQSEAETPTLENALGLLDPAQRTKPPKIELPRKWLFFSTRPDALVTPAAVACIHSLDEIVHQHRETAITIRGWDGVEREELIGNLAWRFPTPNQQIPLAEDLPRLPLNEIWETWWSQRKAALRDADGFELLRASAPFEYRTRRDSAAPRPDWVDSAVDLLFGGVKPDILRYRQTTESLLLWLLRLHSPPGAPNFLLDTLQTSLAVIAEHDATTSYDWRSELLGWLNLAREHRDLCPDQWQNEHHTRLWHLLRWIDEPAPGADRRRPQLAEVLAAHKAGAATEADLFDQLLGPQDQRGWYAFYDLKVQSGRKPSALALQHPLLLTLVERCRQRILEVEIKRGDLPTAVSQAALKLRWSGGLDALMRLLKGFGQARFVRGGIYTNQSRTEVFSHLIRRTAPVPDDDSAAFAKAVEEAGIPERQLIEVALYAPQWAAHVEAAIGWPGFAGAVQWILAHAAPLHSSAEPEVAELWQAQISEHTPLPATLLAQGAVDVRWFWLAYDELGPIRWERVYKAAQFATDGAGYKRSQLFADAMLGRVTQEELVSRIRTKRYQDAVRALGLLPLGSDSSRDAQLLARYEIIQEFVRTSKQFGSQRQENEKLAASIALENLARTAGYTDPQRLQWIMEASAVADLAQGPVRVKIGDVTVTLAIDPWGEPEITVMKGDRPLKAIPATIRKDLQIAELQTRKTELKRQRARMRLSLEQAMIRGDGFRGTELRQLFTNPILARMIEDLVLIGMGIVGYPEEGGMLLRKHDGRLQPVAANETVRIAHPYDLLRTGEWHLWQHDCFVAERTQPFKQVFRELYLLTEAEKFDATVSRRYEGQQVNTKQALALLAQRAWVNHPDEGVRRTFHAEGVSAILEAMGSTWTPADVEGLTVETVSFTRSGEWQRLPLVDIPPRLFSEVMRDLDLVVSVAHAGGVDPEATASTVEMRAVLVRETCAVLGLDNVRVQRNHALIDGNLANYSLHLGSGVVHRQPGGALCIVPVHGQHRGRLFLPFADNDPKTAEVMAKTLLLAKDADIKDPTILEQILATRSL